MHRRGNASHSSHFCRSTKTESHEYKKASQRYAHGAQKNAPEKILSGANCETYNQRMSYVYQRPAPARIAKIA